MTEIEIAARLIAIGAHTTLARSSMLLKDNSSFLRELLEARRQLEDLCNKIVSVDEAHIYVAT